MYLIHLSPLHAISSKKRLAQVLNTDTTTLRQLIKQLHSNNIPYKEFSEKKNGKTRAIQNPFPILKKIQKRIKKLLSRITTPEWLISGKKGISYPDNGRYHQKNKIITCLDIHSFYQHVEQKYVLGFFLNDLQMTSDVAGILTDLVMFPSKEGRWHLPTGAPSSQVIAFWAFHTLFERLHQLAQNRGIRMSLYVDDITLSSSKPIPRSFIKLFHNAITSFGLSLKTQKIKRYGISASKEITGCIITPEGHLRVPNKLRKKLFNLLNNKSVEKLDFDTLEKAYGILNSVRQIEPLLFPVLYAKIDQRFKILRPFQKKYQKRLKHKHNI